MSAFAAPPVGDDAARFRHDVFLYGTEEEFLDGALEFLLNGLAADEPALVVLSERKIGLLRDELGSEGDRVVFADMAEIGGNPARILPVWQRFVGEHVAAGRSARGIGEPVWADRSPAELVECHRHEALLNFAFASAPPWWLICPYDTTSLPAEVIEEAFNSHPHVITPSGRQPSDRFRGNEDAAVPFSVPLPEPPPRRHERSFDASDVAGIRLFVGSEAVAAGLGRTRAADFALAAHELATNSVRYGGGEGVFRLWREPGAIVCEVRDQGHLSHPLAGRELPAPDQEGGRGLWLVNQLCDLVQARSMPDGNVIRVRMRIP